MNQRWTLHVENFARIESADIEIAPLMCFIGDNNSGKSYVMSLLWGILSNSDLFYRQFKTSSTYDKCNQWLSQVIKKKKIVIEDEIEQIYLQWFNELLFDNKEELVKRIFNNENIDIGKLELLHFRRLKKLTVDFNRSIKFSVSHIQEIDVLEYEETDRIGITLPISSENLDIIYWKSNVFICWNIIMMGLTDIFPPEGITSQAVYLPASRTGFLLARREIVSKSIESLYSLPNYDSIHQESLTAPYIQFLQIMNNLKDSDNSYDKKNTPLIEFLQDEILHGSVIVKSNGKIIRYLPDDIEGKEFSMSITSSVVTEITALLLLLKDKTPLKLIIIEEPEAHLHPALQKKIAQLLIHFVHSGIPIWITTHSDTILQHFNNMIKLNNRSSEREELMKEFNYSEKDLLNPSEINLYQFERGEKHTTIEKLESGRYGFVGNLFNKAIDELVKEIYAFQEVE
mgnify:CR=1 FL=1